MNDNKRVPANEGYQPFQKGYQPSPGKVTGGHQPTTSEKKPSIPQPPPKKP
jgi:hypothetical protein